MSAATGGSEGEQAQQGLFGQGQLPQGAQRVQRAQVGGPPRVMSPQRNQVELRPVDLESIRTASASDILAKVTRAKAALGTVAR